MYVCMYVCVYTYIYIYIYNTYNSNVNNTHVFLCLSLSIYLSLSLYIYIYICIHVFICVCVCVYVCMYVCIYIYIYIHIYTHTRMDIIPALRLVWRLAAAGPQSEAPRRDRPWAGKRHGPRVILMFSTLQTVKTWPIDPLGLSFNRCAAPAKLPTWPPKVTVEAPKVTAEECAKLCREAGGDVAIYWSCDRAKKLIITMVIAVANNYAYCCYYGYY